MTITRTQLRTELRDHLGLDEDECDNDAADLLINRSWWEIMDKLDFREKESSYVITTVDGTHTYDCDVSQEAVQAISIIDPDSNKTIQLERLTLEEYIENYDSDDEEEAIPTHYLRRGNEITLWPTPDDEYTVTVYHHTILADIGEDGPTIPQSWHEIILYGAIWRGYLRGGDYNRGNAAKSHQVSLIQSATPVEAKETQDSRYAGLEVLRRPYR